MNKLDDILVCLLFVLMLFIGFILGLIVNEKIWNRWCLENGHAHYNTKLGAFVLHDKKDALKQD